MMELLNFVKRLSPSKVKDSSGGSLSKSSIVSNLSAGTSSLVEYQFIVLMWLELQICTVVLVFQRFFNTFEFYFCKMIEILRFKHILNSA